MNNIENKSNFKEKSLNINNKSLNIENKSNFKEKSLNINNKSLNINKNH